MVALERILIVFIIIYYTRKNALERIRVFSLSKRRANFETRAMRKISLRLNRSE